MLSEEETKSKFDKMFGFVFEQPIHLTLRQMRFIPLALLYCCIDMMYIIIDNLDKLDPMQAAIAYAAIAMALISVIVKGFDSFIKRHERDD
jgi:hypothetical protein